MMKSILLLISCFFVAWQSPGSEPAQATVAVVKTFTLADISEHSAAFNYRDRGCAFWKGDGFICVRPLGAPIQAGEIQFCLPLTGNVNRMRIPQPQGFRPKFPSSGSYFDSEGIWVNKRGDVFLRWMLEGNGDHALALFSDESKTFVTQRIKFPLGSNSHSRAIARPDGSWYFLVWRGHIKVYEVDKELNLSLLGSHNGLGQHTYNVLDACFISNDVLQFIWAQVDDDFHARFLTINFNISTKKWEAERIVGHFDRFVSSAHPRVVMLADKSLHYFWTINEGQRRTGGEGLYYLGGEKKEPVRLSDSVRYKVVAQENKVVLCYTLAGEPEKAFFCVIQAGIPGPETAVKLAKRPPHALWDEDIVLAPAGKDRLWFVNTLDINTFYELGIGPSTK